MSGVAPASDLKKVIVPIDVVTKFIKVAEVNTEIKIETCGILAGKLVSPSAYEITHLIIPRQEGEQDNC